MAHLMREKDSVTDRLRFITHEGKQVLLVDVSNCSAVEAEKIIRAVPEIVSTRPRNSVLILSDFTRAVFNDDAVRALKESAVFDKPYVKKSAWIGTAYLPLALSEAIREFSRREFPSFQSREEALAWLVMD